MVRSGLVHEVGGRGKFPILLVAGVTDLPEYFEQSVSDFDQFLNLITIGGKQGFQKMASLDTRAPALAVQPGPAESPVTPDAGAVPSP